MSSKLENLRLDAAELYRLAALTERRRVQDILTIEAKKLETEISSLQQTEGLVKSGGGGASTIPAKHNYDIKIVSFAWDQSDSVVKIYVNVPKVETLPEEQVNCTFTENSFELRVTGLENKNYVLSQKNLSYPIQPAKSSWKVKSGKVIVSLSKQSHSTWSNLNKVETDKKKVPSMDDTPNDPTAGIMSLMKQMYEDGDDEMKRSIAKAWTESREKSMNFDM